MRKILYFFRVLIISLESLTLATCAYASIIHREWLNSISTSLEINDEMLKYLILFPLGLAAWLLNELRQLVFENEATAKILIKWPDYWRLKCHISVSLVYTSVFSAMSAAPWMGKSGISTEGGLALFTFGIIGQLIVATSVYLARFSVRELTIDAK